MSSGVTLWQNIIIPLSLAIFFNHLQADGYLVKALNLMSIKQAQSLVDYYLPGHKDKDPADVEDHMLVKDHIS